MPIGWYRAEFETLAQGTDETETVRQLVMVFQHEQSSYAKFIEHLTHNDINAFAGETIETEQCQRKLDRWQQQFFAQADHTTRPDIHMNLLHIARHMAQNENEAPVFFPFSEREHHDLDKLAQKFSFDDNLGAIAVNQALMVEYKRADRYWQAIYYNYQLFKSQYDACVNRLLSIQLHGGEEPPPPSRHSDEPQDREPSDEVKEQVKIRDHYICLCCGETNRRILQIDHIAPSYYGGNNSFDNLQTLCRKCNQTKEVNDLNFRTHQTPLRGAASDFEVFKLPGDSKDLEEWKKSLQRCINFFYRCAAVQSIKIGKRGQYFHEWYVMLYAGNDPEWLKPHLKELVKQINKARRGARAQTIKGIRVGAPDHADVVSK